MIKELVLVASFATAHQHLTEAIYHEARGEERCQYYVAGVIKNRMLSEHFPDTIQGVIEDPGQFEYKNKKDLTMYEEDAALYASQVAEAILTSEHAPSFRNILFFNTPTVNNTWGEEVLTCGNHIFYKKKD